MRKRMTTGNRNQPPPSAPAEQTTPTASNEEAGTDIETQQLSADPLSVGRAKNAAKPKEGSAEWFDLEIKRVEYETSLITLQRTKDENAEYMAERTGKQVRERNAQVLLDRARREREAVW